MADHHIPFSILDLATITEGESAGESFRRSVEAAQLAEASGYTRYWFAEHHNMESVASSATSLLIGHIAGATHSMRVGSGGIMLPNHAPLIIAEQFGTLESLYPGRIDLGLGRAPAIFMRREILQTIFPNCRLFLPCLCSTQRSALFRAKD